MLKWRSNKGQIWCKQKHDVEKKNGSRLARVLLQLIFGEFGWLFLKEKTAKDSIRKEQEIMQIERYESKLTTFWIMDSRTVDSDLRWEKDQWFPLFPWT